MKFLLSVGMMIVFCTLFSANAVAQTDTTITIKVKGITCSTDLTMIKNNVEKLEGVIICKIVKQANTSIFEVKYFNDQLTVSDIYKAIESTGSCEKPDERPYQVKK